MRTYFIFFMAADLCDCVIVLITESRNITDWTVLDRYLYIPGVPFSTKLKPLMFDEQ